MNFMLNTLNTLFATAAILVSMQWTSVASAQQSNQPEHKIVFQLTTGDTTSHKQLMKQLQNIHSISPSTKMEVVCHGPGIEILIQGKSIVEEKIKLLSEMGVEFNACEFTLKEKKIDKSTIIQEAGFVPGGIIEIVTKQEQGWSYIKAGI